MSQPSPAYEPRMSSQGVVYQVGVLACPCCGGRFRLIALIETCSFNQDTDIAAFDSYA